MDLDSTNLIAAFSELERKTQYQFFYDRNWFKDVSLSGSYDSISLKEVLTDMLNNTIFNYYIIDNKVVITKNAIIYDELPKGFFVEKKDSNALTTNPVAVRKSIPIFIPKNSSQKQNKVLTFSVGKVDENATNEKLNLSGFVTTKKTKEPLANLALLVKGENSGIVTDADGYYEVDLDFGPNELEARALGIESTTISVIMYNNGKLDIQLEEEIEQLDEVVLSADLKRNILDKNTGSTQIDVEETKTVPLVLGERDVLKVATNLPGITTAGEATLGFNVRGGKTDQNLILFDNAVLYNPQHFFGIFSAINPFTLGSVEIFKGNIPAEYGGRLSSVFDLKTKSNVTDDFDIEGSIGPVTGNLAIGIPVVKGKSKLTVAGRGAYANWLLRSLNDESLNNSEASFYDFTASYEHQINDANKVKVTGYGSRDDFSITSDSLFVYNNRLVSVNWNNQLNEKNALELNLSNTQFGFNIEFDGNSNNDFDLGYVVNETGLGLKLKRIFNKSFSLDYGIASKFYSIDPGRIEPRGTDSDVNFLEIPTEQALESAVFLSSEIDIGDKLTLDAGVRFSLFNALGPSTQFVYDENSPRTSNSVVDTLNFGRNELVETYGGPEFRVAARYIFNQDFSIKGSFNNTIQYIHRLSNNTTVSPIDTWKLSDFNIRPQTGNQWNLGLYRNLKENEYELSLEGFYKNSNDILDFKTGAQILLNENIETEVLQGSGRAYGVELLIKKNRGKLNGWLGYTFSRSFVRLDSDFSEERVNNGEFFPANFDKPHDFSLVGNYKFTRRLSLSANVVYQTGRPVTFPIGNFMFNNSNFVAFSDRNEFRIPDFYRLDLGFNIEGNHKKSKLAHGFWTISIYNVLGRNNPFSVFFVTRDGEIRPLQSSIFAIPIPSITYNFKF